MLDETPGLCMLSLGCAREREKQQLSWEDSRGGSSAPLEPEKVGMTNRTVAYKNWSPRLVPRVTSTISVLLMIFIVPSLQTLSGCMEGAEGKLDGAWVSQFVLGMCWEPSRRERIHNYTLLLFNEGRVHLVNFPG